MHTKVLGVPDLELRPIQYRDSLCVDLGMLPVSEGITAPPFISRAFAFCIPELISRRLIRVDVPPNHTWDFKCHLQADRVLKSWFSMVLQALCIQSPGSAWAHPTSEDPDPTPGSILEFDPSCLGLNYIGGSIAN
jgi:hypothetical protein